MKRSSFAPGIIVVSGAVTGMGKYTAAEWKWEADEGDPRVQHISRLYSGVVVGHLHRPFWVGCKIQPLLSYSDPLRRLKRYIGRPSKGGDKYAFVEIPLGPTDTNPETDLEAVVRLDEEIAQLMGSNPKQVNQHVFPVSRS